MEEQHKTEKELDEIIAQIVDFFTAHKSDLTVIKPIMDEVKSMGYANPKEITSVEDAKKILAFTLKK